ncbi:tetratricopeptide repeat protein [Trichuris suis]|nr:tetratricopeptide repeat protein [Trichuris suis]
MNDGEAQMELITAVDSGWQQSATRDLQKQLSDHICSTALSILASLLEYIPGLLAVFFLKACFHILRDDVDKATEELRECLAKDAENSSVYLLLAEISLRQGNYNEAKSTLEAAVSYDFNVRHQPNYHLIRARLAAALNDTKEAIAILNNAVKLHCLNSPKGEIRLELAKLLQLNGDLAEAEELLTDLSQQHDEDQEGQIILSQCDLLLRRNDVNKALNLLSEISSDKWYYVQARKVMADIYLTYRKDKRQYIACFKLAKSERSVRGEDNVEHLLQACRYAYALFVTQTQCSLCHRLSQSIGNFYEGQHAYSKAAVYYTEGLKYDAKNIKLMLNLAHIYLITNNLEECHQQCRAVMKIDKNNDEATLELRFKQKNDFKYKLMENLLLLASKDKTAPEKVLNNLLRMGGDDASQVNE